MRNTFLLIGGLAFFAALNAQARIGYTLEQCIAQYGSEYKTIPQSAKYGDAYYWETDGFRIWVNFAPGSPTAGCIAYQPKFNGEEETHFLSGDPEKDYAEFYKSFSPEVINDLLQKNAPGSVWKKTKTHAKDETDYRSPVATAVYYSHVFGSDDEVNRNGEYDHPQLEIKTVEYKKFEEVLAKQTATESTPEPKKLASDKL